MRMPLTVVAILLALVLSAFGPTPAEAQPDPIPYADPEYIDSGGTTQLYGPTYVFCNIGGTWELVQEWQWTDNGAGGTFSPNASVKNPLYTASGNHSGTYKEHHIQVTSYWGSCQDVWDVYVYEMTDPHYVTVSASVSPSSVMSGGTVSLTGSATCTSGHAIDSWSWKDNVTGGSFEPSSYEQSPDYIAPTNTTGSNLSVTLTLRATCEGSISGEDSTTLTVTPPVHAVEVTASCDPEVIVYGDTTQCSAVFLDTFEHEAASWLWDDGGAGGTFLPSADVQNPTYQAPSDDPGSHTQVALTVTAECDDPSPLQGSDTVELTVAHGCVLTVTSAPLDGVAVGVGPADLGGRSDGTTPFARVYAADSLVDLTAPSEIENYLFSVWTLNEVVQPTGQAAISVSMDTSHAATAHYLPHHFSDVPLDYWAYESVEACYGAAIVAGYADGLYHGDWAVTRGQMAVYIARALVAPTGEAALADYVPADPRNFPDAPPTGYGDDGTEPYWAYKHIEYCVENGVVQGYADGNYHPDEEVNRAQMAVYIARALVSPSGEAGLADYVPADPRDFPDVPPTGYGDDGTEPYWAYMHIEYCVEHGVVQGYLDGLYHPDEAVTRDQMAVYVARAFELAS